MSINDLRLVCRSDADPKNRREFWLTWRYEKLYGDTLDNRSDWQRSQFATKARGLIPGQDPFTDWDAGEWSRMVGEMFDPAIEAWQAEKSLGAGVVGGSELESITLPELDAMEIEERYLINGVIPELEHGIFSANIKNCKTHLVADACVSLATGTNFLNFPAFDVPRVVNAGLVSSETSKKSFKEMFRRVCDAHGTTPRDVPNVVLSTSRPQLPMDLPKVRRFIEKHKLEFLGLDPSYLLFSDMADRSASDMAMGQVLGMVSEVGNQTGCTIALVNHSTKHRPKDAKRYEPPDLNEIAHAGFSAWMRWWVLLNTRKPFDKEVGQHWLNMVTGGSGTDSGAWCLDIFEGKRSDPNGRVWQVEVRTASEDRKQSADEAEQIEFDRHQRTIDANVGKLRKALKKFPEGETEREVRSKAGLSGAAMAEALEVLEGRGEVRQCQVRKGNRTYAGITYSDPHALNGTSGTNGTWSGNYPACPVEV